MDPLEFLNDPIYEKILQKIVNRKVYTKAIFGDLLYFGRPQEPGYSPKPGLILINVALFRPCDGLWIIKKFYGPEGGEIAEETSKAVWEHKPSVAKEIEKRTQANLKSRPKGSIIAESFEVDLNADLLGLLENGFPKPEPLTLEDYGYSLF